ncbi:MAG: SDR family oxidoreductase [Trebonia sp.]|jgi:nucleoside-diphosphate-sugar epimerase
MRIFVTGATGFIGSAVVTELIEAGHQVAGLARSDQAAAALEQAGARPHRGDLADLDSLRAGAAESDGVIHTAFTNISATTSMADSARADLSAIEAIGQALAGSGKPFMVTSGTGLLKAGRVGTEEDEPDPASHAAPRIPSEQATLALAARGVRSAVVRLSFSVHGDGDHGFVPAIIEMAKAKGVSAYPGDGASRWPAVHRLDAARLFRLGAESAPAGSRLHGVADEGVPFRDIAAVIGKRLDLPVRSVTGDEVAGHFGWLAAFVAADAPASSELTRKLLGWQPAHPGLIADIDTGHYFD